MANQQFIVQIGDSLLGEGIGDEAAWRTDSVHADEAAARGAAATRRAQRAAGSDLVYRVVRVETMAPYAKTLVIGA